MRCRLIALINDPRRVWWCPPRVAEPGRCSPPSPIWPVGQSASRPVGHGPTLHHIDKAGSSTTFPPQPLVYRRKLCQAAAAASRSGGDPQPFPGGPTGAQCAASRPSQQQRRARGPPAARGCDCLMILSTPPIPRVALQPPPAGDLPHPSRALPISKCQARRIRRAMDWIAHARGILSASAMSLHPGILDPRCAQRVQCQMHAPKSVIADRQGDEHGAY